MSSRDGGDFRHQRRHIRQRLRAINTAARAFSAIPASVRVYRTNPDVLALGLMPRSLSFVLLMSPRRTITRFEVFAAALRSLCRTSLKP